MSRWRIVVVLALIILPILFLAGLGSYFLWQSGLSLALWWPMMACLALGYILAYRWHRARSLLGYVDYTPPEIAAERDRKAWQLVELRAKAGAALDSDTLTSPEHYLQTAEEVARELAAYYYPKEQDPVGGLTLPEMLAVCELAARDLGEMVDRYLPGGHLLTIRDFRNARKAVEWYQSANSIYWMVTALFSPINTAIRYMASQAGLSQPFKALQQDLLVWFHSMFLQRLGYYLIELYSGRLRVGAKRWRELVQGDNGDGQPRVVTLTLIGQVKAGKSSLVNALLGERKARTDVLPKTDAIERFQLAAPGMDAQLLLLDTPGYGNAGPKADQLVLTQEAAQKSDLLLLVLHSRNPARQADVSMLQSLREWFTQGPDLKMPPILAVVTHIDLLSPSLEWLPPYNWQKGERAKERNIREALAATEEQLGELVDGIVPACTAEGKVFGIEEAVLPALAVRLDEARVVSVLRCLRAESDRGKVLKVFGQLLQAGKGLVRAVWEKKT
jgi:predicted GTPase